MMAIRVACFVLWLTIGLYGKLAFGARYNVMGSQDEEQQIRLKSQYDLTPGTILQLPIDVEEEAITLYGLLPPRLKTITSSSANGVYGTGDTIYIDLIFSSAVEVVGARLLQ